MINGKITKIKNKNGEITFPITSSQAVLMSDGVTSVEDALSNIEVSGNAEGTSFDNSSNGMSATNVQDAIEENKTTIEENKASIEENKKSIEANKTSILSLQSELGTNRESLITSCNQIIDLL